MIKNLWRQADLPRWNGIGLIFEINMLDFAETVYEKKLDQIVSPFETNIPFQTIIRSEGDKKRIIVQPIPGIYSSNRVRGVIETATLFRYLNDGTSKRYAVMPDDFANETFPGTLNTVAQRYSRRRIYLDTIARRGVEGRRWLEILEEMTREQLKTAVRVSMSKAVSHAFNIR
jgi:hypothetical protein